MSRKSHGDELTSRTLTVGFYWPGVFAGVIENIARYGEGAESAVKRVRAIEREMWFECCGGKHPVAIFTRREIREMYAMATDGSYEALNEAAEKIYRGFTAICPACGLFGKLPLNV